MPIASHLQEELLELSAAYCDGVITASNLQRLEQILRGDAAAQSLYVQYMEIHTSLAWKSSADMEFEVAEREGSPDAFRSLARTSPVAVAEPRSQGRLRHALHHVGSTTYSIAVQYPVIASAAAALVIAIVVGTLAIVRLPNQPPENVAVAPPNYIPNAVATLTATVDAAWQGDVPRGQRPQFLPGRTLELMRGSAEITFVDGAVVTIRSPSTIRIQGPSAGKLLIGSLAARVEGDAIGFVINTPLATITDLGTEFAVNVDDDGTVDVLVSAGAVEVAQLDGEQQSAVNRLVAGEGLRVDGSGARTVKQDSRRFVEPITHAYRDAVLADRPLAYYRLSTPYGHNGGLVTTNDAEVGRVTPGPALNPAGGFSGFESGNRWANFHGGPGSTLTGLATGWSSDAGTFSYWIRMDGGAGRTMHGLIGKADRGGGSVARPAGTIGAFTRSSDGSLGLRIGACSLDAGPGTISNDRWHHFAATWRRNTGAGDGEARIYLDGVEVAATTTGSWASFTIDGVGDSVMRFGKAVNEIADRRFHGSADEIAIWNRALPPTRIKEHVNAATKKTE